MGTGCPACSSGGGAFAASRAAAVRAQRLTVVVGIGSCEAMADAGAALTLIAVVCGPKSAEKKHLSIVHK